MICLQKSRATQMIVKPINNATNAIIFVTSKKCEFYKIFDEFLQSPPVPLVITVVVPLLVC